MKGAAIDANRIRHKIYTIDYFLSVRDSFCKVGGRPSSKSKRCYLIDGYYVNRDIYNRKMSVFGRNNFRCVNCGLGISHVVLESSRECDISLKIGLLSFWHFGQYEIEMTLDHMIARALGGRNILRNLQTMCIVCNNEKSYFENVHKQDMKKRGIKFAA